MAVNLKNSVLLLVKEEVSWDKITTISPHDDHQRRNADSVWESNDCKTERSSGFGEQLHVTNFEASLLWGG